MRMARMQQLLVQRRLIAQQQQPFRVGIETADWINAFGKSELSQRPVRRTVGGKLGEHTKRFVKSDQHAIELRLRYGCASTRNM